MKLLFSFIFFFLLLTQFSYTQELFKKQPYDHIWLLGHGDLMIDFNSSPPVYDGTINSQIDFHNANSSICDTNGVLQLYSNGLQVLNGSFEFLLGGDRINSGEFLDDWLEIGNPLPQGLLILPSHESNRFHLFYTEPFYFINQEGEQDISARNLYYSEADFFTPSSQGELIDEDFILVSDTLDAAKITACKHGNGRDWWVLVPRLDASQYHKLLISDQGIENQGIISTESVVRRGLGQAKFSPDGSKYINFSLPEFGISNLAFYDFNRCTGELSILNTEVVEVINNTGGVSISENSRFVYQSAQFDMYQYDLEAEDIIASKTLIGEYDGFYNGDNPNFNWTTFALSQLAPDGRIYIATSVSAPQMHLVHEPNKRGLASRFEQRAIKFPVWNTRTIPNFPYYGLGPWDGSPCDTLNIDNPTPEAAFEYTQDTLGQQIEFFDASHYAYAWEWSFGDGSELSTEQHPIHTYETSGAYDICLTVSNVTGTDIYCETIYIGVNSTQEVFVPGVSVEVAPNPFQERFSVQVNNHSRLVQMRIYNVAGQQVYEDILPGSREKLIWVNSGEWPRGLYFYELWNNDIKLATGKIVKQ